MSRSVPTFSSEIYDVALSFAGEDRVYVEAVALALKANNVKVFYDSFEKSNLWGKNLYDHLHDIYQKKSRFTVIFISTNYAKKAWTNHERQAAQARAFNENSEYILPARFDDTSIPGLDNTVGYISLTNLPPNEFVEIILNKLKSPSTNTTLDPAINHTIALPISPEKTRTKIPPTSTVIILLFFNHHPHYTKLSRSH